MGRYDDVDPAALRTHLVRLARLILELDREGSLLREAPRLQKVLGDLRQRLFAYEVRGTADLDVAEAEEPDAEADPEGENPDPLVEESLRIVREALERNEELRDELDGGHSEENEEDE